MFENTSSEHCVVARHDARHIFGRLAHVDTHFLAARVHRVPTQLHHRHLHGLAGAVGRFLEDERYTLTGQHMRQIGAFRQLQNSLQLGCAEVGDVEEMARHGGHFTKSARVRVRMATASSISATETLSGGARRNAVPVTALVTRPLARSAE